MGKHRRHKLPTIPGTFGAWLRTQRINAKISQIDLAETIGVHPTTVSGWELSKNGPERKYIKRCADLFGYDYDQLLELDRSVYKRQGQLRQTPKKKPTKKVRPIIIEPQRRDYTVEKACVGLWLLGAVIYATVAVI